MLKSAWVLSAALLAVGVCFLAGARAWEANVNNPILAARAAAPDVAKLADLVGKPDDFKKQAAIVVFKNDDLEPLMLQLGAVEKGGMQIGQPGGLDSIELELLRLTKKPPSANQLAQNAADVQRMGEVLCAIAEVTPYYSPQRMKAPQRKRWNGFAGDMSDSARELIRVVKANDAKSLPTVVARLNGSCADCHILSRDGRPLVDVVQAAAAVNKPVQLKASAEGLVRRWGLDEISSALKPRGQGGLTPGGIEADLLELGKHPPTADDLPALAPTLQQAAEMVRAIAEATPDYRKEYKAKPGAPTKWSFLADDMKRGADDLITAVKVNDVAGVRKAIGALNQSCADCHQAYR